MKRRGACAALAVAFGGVIAGAAACGDASSTDGGAPTFDASGTFEASSRSDATSTSDANADAGTPGDASDAGPIDIAFASDATWSSSVGEVDAGDASATGLAARVCYNATSPPNCPPGAVIYGFPGTVAQLSLASIPGSFWIWRGDVAPTGSADLAVAIFDKTFTLGPSPTGSIQIAADDYAEVRVNGISVGTIGSVTDIGLAGDANSQLHTFDLSAHLRQGTNVITVIAQNGPASFAGGCGGSPCTYADNPAAVVFGGTLHSN